MMTHWLEGWLRVLDGGVDEVAEVELRQNSPFAGALPQETRSQVLAAFIRHWRDFHASHTTEPASRPRRRSATSG